MPKPRQIADRMRHHAQNLRAQHAARRVCVAHAVLLLAILLAASATARAQDADDQYTDTRGQRHSFTTTYARSFGAGAGKPDYLRAAIEGGTLLGFGTVWYLSNPTANQADWEFSRLSDKLDPTKIRFDNNQFTTNMLAHPVSGSGYYGFGRINHLSIAASLGYAFAGSAIWEYVFEWREKVSINDMIMTPIGGMVMGECFAKLVDYVSSGPQDGPWLRQGVRYTLGIPDQLHYWMDGAAPDDGLPTDELGFSSAYAHDFRLGYELARVSNDAGKRGTQHALVAESEVIAIPGFLRPGRFRLTFSDGNFTEMALRMGFGEGDLVDVEVWLRAALFGYYSQRLDYTKDADLRGHALAISVVSAFANEQRWFLDRRDELGVMHLAGPALDAWLTSSGFWLRARLEGTFDFAALRPLAFSRFRQLHPDGTIKTVLTAYGYDYYFGLSLRLRLTLTYEPFELGQRFAYGTYDSISGIDRFEEEITRRTDSTEEVIVHRVWLGVTAKPLPLQVRLRYETRMRTGRIEQETLQRWERLPGVDLLLKF